MAKKQKPYFGQKRIVTLILAIFPLTNIVLGIIIRITRDNLLGAVLNFFLAPFFWIIDLVTIILYKDLIVLA